MKALLIPFKDPSRAKTRLSTLLSEDERRRLALAMFDDVTGAVAAASQADRIFMISCFAPALQRAGDLGWDLLIEESQVSESASVDWACSILSERGFNTAMRLPADVPLVRPADIDELLSIRLETPGAVLVPSREGSGTNAIIRTPPNLFPSRFGPNSLALHMREAARVGVECMIVKNSRIALDIDEPADVEQLLEAGRGTRAFALLCEINVFDRLRPGSAGIPPAVSNDGSREEG
jgi:2-phospho-L-lactate guanylyltransferase